MSERQTLLTVIRETAALRREIITRGVEEGSLTIEFTNRDLAAIVYALSCTWISEYVSGIEGYEEMRSMISSASDAILAADAGTQVDKAIEQILGKHNPEVDGDGA